MRNFITILFLFIYANSFCQNIIPAIQSDIFIDKKADIINTGISISSDALTNTAVVYDYNGPNKFILEVMNNNGTNIFFRTNYNNCYDPDVAFSRNFDVLMLSYTKITSIGPVIFLDEYRYSNSPPFFNLVNSTYIGNGDYSNIDFIDGVNLSAQPKGLLTYEVQGKIMMHAISNGNIISPQTYIGQGKTPDVAMQHNGKEATITYVSNKGHLEIFTFDFNALTINTLTTLNKYDFKPKHGYSYEIPRIASLHNKNAGSYSNFTVVTQEQNPSGNYDIEGFFYEGFTNTMKPKVLINNKIEKCFNYAPVVTYSYNKVNIAWGARYSTSCTNVNYIGISDDILMREFDHEGHSISTLGDFSEINKLQNTFSGLQNISISTKYDSQNMSITQSNTIEDIVYVEFAMNLYYKSRSFNASYKAATEIFKTSNSKIFRILKNPVTDLLQIQTNYKNTIITIHNNIGKLLLTKKLNIGDNSIDLTNFTKGIYYIQNTSTKNNEQFKIIKK